MNPTHVEQGGPPRVTVLIVTRNSASHLQRCLDALEASEQRDQIEVLVVDNGSADGTADIPGQFPEVQTLRLPKNFGRTKASNIGMRTAKGDLVFFLPSHVAVHADTIHTLADRLQSSDAIGAVCPLIPQWYRLPTPAALNAACPSGELPDPQPTASDAAEISIDYPGDAPMLVRRSFLRSMNYFDEHFGERWADLDLCSRLRNAGKTILVLPQVHVDYGTGAAPVHDSAHASDCVVGAAHFISKQAGSTAAMKFRVSALLGALLRFQFSLFTNLISGQKIDGTQA